MYTFILTEKSKIELEKFSASERGLIIKKLTFLKEVSDLYSFMKAVINLLPATHRIRIGNFRLLVKIEKNDVIILKIGHRKDIYK